MDLDYGNVIPKPSAPTTDASRRAYMQSTRNGENYASGKTKMVAWFVSHCYTQSRREKYVSLLRQYIPVDIYGGCYTHKCPLNERYRTLFMFYRYAYSIRFITIIIKILIICYNMLIKLLFKCLLVHRSLLRHA